MKKVIIILLGIIFVTVQLEGKVGRDLEYEKSNENEQWSDVWTFNYSKPKSFYDVLYKFIERLPLKVQEIVFKLLKIPKTFY